MFIDTHAHIYLEKFQDDFADLMNRAKNAEVEHILMPNIDFSTLNDVFKRSTEYPTRCLPMIGLHPCSITKDWENEIELIRNEATRKKIYAIGESGIDLYWDKTLEKEQKLAFRRQIEWAIESDLPIVIHSRSAIKFTIEIISELQQGSLRGVFHCFDQTYAEARKIMDLGFFMGIGGVISYKKNEALREAIAKVPLEYLVLETDAPYLPPTPYRGKRNEPAYIPIIAEYLASIKQISIKEIADQTSSNARSLFRI